MVTAGETETNATKNARILYQSCMNETNIEVEGVDPILFIIHSEFRGWPILEGPNWNNSTYNLTQLLLKLRKYDDGLMFSITTATNQQNSSIYDIEVSIRIDFYQTIFILIESNTSQILKFFVPQFYHKYKLKLSMLLLEFFTNIISDFLPISLDFNNQFD